MSIGIHELPYTAEQINTAINNCLNRNFNQNISAPVLAGDTVVISNFTEVVGTSTTLSPTGLSITIPVNGIYRLKWNVVSARNTATYIQTSQLYKNNIAVGVLQTLTPSSANNSENYTLDLECVAGDVITVYLDAYSASYPASSNYLVACISGSIGFAE